MQAEVQVKKFCAICKYKIYPGFQYGVVSKVKPSPGGFNFPKHSAGMVSLV